MNLPSPSPARAGVHPNAKWLFFFGFLTVFMILDCVHDFVARRGEGSFVDVLGEIQGGILYWGPCLALVPVIIVLVNRYPPSLRQPRLIALHALFALIFSYLNSMIQAIPLHEFDGALSYWARFFFMLKFDFALNYALYGFIAVSVNLLRQYEDLKEREVRESQLEVALGEARLRAIQAQLNPHFFFNTLQAISVMAMAGEREGVVEVLGRLSSLLRVSFDKQRPQRVSLGAEMEFTEGYLAIHQLCFEHRLTIQRQLSPATLEASVPSMLLQPLVENAIVHGIAVKPGQGIIRISGGRNGDELILEVADNGPGFQRSQPYRLGVGLSSTESRLNLLFGAQHSIEYGPSDLGGASVRIRFPFVPASTQALPLDRGVAA